MSVKNIIERNKGEEPHRQVIEITINGGTIANISASNGIVTDVNEQGTAIRLANYFQQESQPNHKKLIKRIIAFCVIAIIVIALFSYGLIVIKHKCKQIKAYETSLQQREDSLKHKEELLQIEMESFKMSKFQRDSISL